IGSGASTKSLYPATFPASFHSKPLLIVSRCSSVISSCVPESAGRGGRKTDARCSEVPSSTPRSMAIPTSRDITLLVTDRTARTASGVPGSRYHSAINRPRRTTAALSNPLVAEASVSARASAAASTPTSSGEVSSHSCERSTGSRWNGRGEVAGAGGALHPIASARSSPAPRNVRAGWRARPMVGRYSPHGAVTARGGRRRENCRGLTRAGSTAPGVPGSGMQREDQLAAGEGEERRHQHVHRVVHVLPEHADGDQGG